MPSITMAAALEVLKSDRCLCHHRKKVKQALCTDCYIALPTAMQKALWRGLGAGFEEAYAAAKAWLLRGYE
jgi:hypothetical protein